MDPRYGKLADVLCGFSTRLKKGENVLIDAHDVPDDFVIALIRAARERGATPMVNLHRARIGREMVKDGTRGQFKLAAGHELARMKKMQAYIAVRGSDNIFEGSDVPAAQARLNGEIMRPVLDHRVNKTKWVVLRWPTSSMAQQAKMSTEGFADFYFRVCTLDYSRMIPGMEALRRAMMKTDEVRITGPGTDLTFSIKGMNAIPCGGEYNIPDGEVFTAPIKDSVNGTLQYNCATIYQGVSFENIRLVFRKGKIVEATSNNTKRLNEILDTDGAHASSASSPSASTRTSSIRCRTSCSTRRSRAPSTSRPASATRRPTTATTPQSTGTWCASSAPNTAAGRSASTAS